MATWTELFAEVPMGMSTQHGGMEATELRELLLDLPHHPNLCLIDAVTLRLRDGREIILVLGHGESMASGASGPTVAGAGIQRDTVQPWRVTPVLGDVGGPMTAPDGSVVCPEPFTPPPVENAQPREASEVGLGPDWLEGLNYTPGLQREPGGDHCFLLADAGPREKRSPGGIILETT